MTDHSETDQVAVETPQPLQSPLVDITTINAAESLFRGDGVIDPWASTQAIHLADLYVFSRLPRYPLPVPMEAQGLDQGTPFLLRRLQKLDSDVLTVERCILDPSERHLNPDYLADAFEGFSQWIENNETGYKNLLRVHNQDWIRLGQRERNLSDGYFYNVKNLKSMGAVIPKALALDVALEDLLYTFDVVLRYPLYGEAAGAGNTYLTHPIREQQNLPTMRRENSSPVELPFSFGSILAPYFPALSVEQYANLLHEGRSVLQELKIVDDDTGTFNDGAVTEFMDAVHLTVRLKKPAKALGVFGGILSMLSPLTTWTSVTAAVGGGAISVAANLWSGNVPLGTSQFRWLRWALDWHVTVDEPKEPY